MGWIKDVIDAVRSGANVATGALNTTDKLKRKSIARGANEQTFHFPCLIADSAPINISNALTRHLDRMYASFVQIYLSANGVIDLNFVKNPRQFINQFQSQINLESTDEDDEELQELMEDYADFMYAGNALFVDNKNKVMMLYTEGAMTPGLRKIWEEGRISVQELYKVPNSYYEADGNEVNDVMNALIANTNNKATLDASAKANGPRMNDQDIKKLNDMQPYVLELNLLATKGDGVVSQYMKYNVGVKTQLHLGKSEVLIQNLVYVLQNKSALFNFIRWTTGELSLIKDIMLNLKDINFNVVNKYDGTGKFISALKRMKKKPVRVNGSGLSKVAPCATIVISSYEYATIRDKFGFDLKNLTFANKIMDQLYLMCFAIIDEGSQTVDILVDGSQSGFQTYSLDILEREATLSSNKLGKELTRMLGGN